MTYRKKNSMKKEMPAGYKAIFISKGDILTFNMENGKKEGA